MSGGARADQNYKDEEKRMKIARKLNKPAGVRQYLLPAMSTMAALVASSVYAQQAPVAAAKPEATDKLETINVTGAAMVDMAGSKY